MYYDNLNKNNNNIILFLILINKILTEFPNNINLTM